MTDPEGVPMGIGDWFGGRNDQGASSDDVEQIVQKGKTDLIVKMTGLFMEANIGVIDVMKNGLGDAMADLDASDLGDEIAAFHYGVIDSACMGYGIAEDSIAEVFASIISTYRCPATGEAPSVERMSRVSHDPSLIRFTIAGGQAFNDWAGSEFEDQGPMMAFVKALAGE